MQPIAANHLLAGVGLADGSPVTAVVTDSRNTREGRFIEEVGYYNPLTEPVELKINEERAKYWLGVGAQPTDTVRGLLKKGGVL